MEAEHPEYNTHSVLAAHDRRSYEISLSKHKLRQGLPAPDQFCQLQLNKIFFIKDQYQLIFDKITQVLKNNDPD